MLLRSIAAAALAIAAPALAQRASAVGNAVAAGTVGERFDGYMGFVIPPSPEVRRQVGAVNIKRRNLYIQLASGKNVTADLVGMTTACELFAHLSPFAQAIVNRRWHGYSWREIGRDLDMDYSEVRKAYFRELGLLLQNLSRPGDSPKCA